MSKFKYIFIFTLGLAAIILIYFKSNKPSKTMQTFPENEIYKLASESNAPIILTEHNNNFEQFQSSEFLKSQSTSLDQKRSNEIYRDKEFNQYLSKHTFLNHLDNESLNLIRKKLQDFPDHIDRGLEYLEKQHSALKDFQFYRWPYVDRMMHHFEGNLKGVIYLPTIKSPDHKGVIKINLSFDHQFQNISLKWRSKLLKEDFKYYGENNFIYYIREHYRAIALDPQKSAYKIILFEDYYEQEVLYWGNLYKNENLVGNVFLRNTTPNNRVLHPGYGPFPSHRDQQP